MHKYSRFFQTLHDERARTGNLGRGTHYSILRAVVFNDSLGKPLKDARFADFAVIWDEDHDDRVIEPIEKIYFAGLLPHFLMFGERKGVFTAIFADDVTQPVQRSALDCRIKDLAQNLDNDDSWPAQAFARHDGEHAMIGDSPDKVDLYLKNLMMLWELGLKPAKYEVPKVS